MEQKEFSFRILGSSSESYDFDELLRYVLENKIEVLFCKVDENLIVDLSKEPKLDLNIKIANEAKTIKNFCALGFYPCFIKDGDFFFFAV